MRALVFDNPGDPVQVLRLAELADPHPGPGEIRLRMTHRPILPADLYSIQGIYPIRPELPGSPGFEGVGVVDSLGAGVAHLSKGQRAIPATGMPGTWAEFLVLPAAAVVPIPEAISDQAASQALANPITAWALLNDVLALSPGDWVLQTAAASALGKLTIQLARHRGLRTINVVRRADQTDALLALGADAVISTDRQSVLDEVNRITGANGVRAAIDAVGGAQGAEIAKCLGVGGTMITMGLLSMEPLGPIDAADMIFRGTTIRGFWIMPWLASKPPEMTAGALGELLTLMADKVLDPQVEAEYDLAEYRAAIEHFMRPGRRGKVLLRG